MWMRTLLDYSLHEVKLDPVSVKIRTGVLLKFGNIPILWISKLHSRIALSALEVEYITLSQGMIELVTARILMLELRERINTKLKGILHESKVWEDSTGAQNLGNNKGPLMKSRTNYIGITYNWS